MGAGVDGYYGRNADQLRDAMVADGASVEDAIGQIWLVDRQGLLFDDMETLREAYTWLTQSDEAKGFESVALDSISEIAEVVLNAEKKATKDPRQAYGAMQEQMADIIRAFRDLPGRHVYMSAKLLNSVIVSLNILT